jgi:hypothetical protein
MDRKAESIPLNLGMGLGAVEGLRDTFILRFPRMFA